MKRKQHIKHFEGWWKSMEYGLLGGRPYSRHCIQISLYVNKFLKTYKQLFLKNLKPVLFSIPVVHFAKRIKPMKH